MGKTITMSARYDPEKVRRRAEEALGWEPGSSRDLSFQMLREALKAKPEKWKAAKDIDDMIRTGDHLRAEVPVTAPRVWLIGEHNPYNVEPRFALYPYPPNSAGGRLAKILGLDRRGYLAAFERRNLLDTAKWSAPAARAAASRVRAEMSDGDSAVLLGARVTAAFGFAFEPLRVHRRFADGRGDPDPEVCLGQRGAAFLLVPHPSGRSRAWNDPGLAARVRAAVEGLREGDRLPIGYGESGNDAFGYRFD